MVNNKEQQLNLIFSALSDPTRRAMLKRLADDEMSVAELSLPFKLSKSAVTKHLKVLEKAGLLNRTINGRVHHCRMDATPLETASEWMTFYKAFWNDKFDALDSYLADSS
ncbi:MAG: winged helix-turn-helix transcriptional regulator [Pseudomonadales bacterium]|nr:winged helix-turn-helix transcriptional regulator [Pseudomonadales bacterium]